MKTVTVISGPTRQQAFTKNLTKKYLIRMSRSGKLRSMIETFTALS